MTDEDQFKRDLVKEIKLKYISPMIDEANRDFFHPVGLSLVIICGEVDVKNVDMNPEMKCMYAVSREILLSVDMDLKVIKYAKKEPITEKYIDYLIPSNLENIGITKFTSIIFDINANILHRKGKCLHIVEKSQMQKDTTTASFEITEFRKKAREIISLCGLDLIIEKWKAGKRN